MRLKIYAIILLCSAITSSCQKSLEQNQKVENVTFKASQAIKLYKDFKSNMDLNYSNPRLVTENFAKKMGKVDNSFEIIEESLYESSTRDFDFVEFEIRYNYTNGLLPMDGSKEDNQAIIGATQNRLLIKKDKKSGVVDFELISYIPASLYFIKELTANKQLYNRLSPDFSGFIRHKNIGGDAILLEKVTKGKILQKLYPTKKMNARKVNNTVASSYSECTTYCLPVNVPNPAMCPTCYTIEMECYQDCPPTTPYPGVSVENGVLSFDSNWDFHNLYNRLDDEVENHNALFYDTKTNLTDLQVEAIEISESFDEFKPLRDFEIYFGFASLRQKIENEENIWMENSVLNPNTDPDVLYSETDDVMRTLFNELQVIKIAGIYVTLDIENLLSTNSISTNTISTNTGNSICKRSERYALPNASQMYDNNTRSAKFVAAFNGTYLGLFTRIVAKTKNFKKKSNGNWKKFATICSSKIYGTVVDVNCGDPQLFGTPFKVEKRRRSYKSVRIEFLNSSKIISGQMMGVHSVGPNGNKLYLSKLLTW